jgi:hypothetical protein
MGNQQKEGVHCQLEELYAPVTVMKATEVLLFMLIVAKHGLTVFKSDTKQAFLNGKIGDEKSTFAHLIGGQSEFQRGMLYY